MQKLTNLTNSPHPVLTSDGQAVHLPAFGSMDGDFDLPFLELLVLCGVVRIEQIADTDGEPKKQRKTRKGMTDGSDTYKPDGNADRPLDD